MFQVKELSNFSKVSPDTIRHYTRIGLLRPARNPENGYCQYSFSDSKRLDFIRKAKNLGYSLKEIKQIISESQRGESPCPIVRDLIVHRIKENRARLEELMELQVRMEQALASWDHMPNGVPDGNSICYLIESIGIHQSST